MRRYVKILMLLLAMWMLGGCSMRTVEQLYCLPKRSQAYNNLQLVIDEAMKNLTFSAPTYGENRQPVQMADLDGDGVDEVLLFARDNSEKPLKILIFSQLASGYVLMDTIEGYGLGFDFVEYAQLDDRPGMEIVVGRQVSDQVVRALSVYRFTSGTARQLLATGYNRLEVCDLDGDEQKELFLLTHSSVEDGNGHVSLYHYQNGEMRGSEEQTISLPASRFSRFTEGKLEDGRMAMYVTCETDNKTMVTDIFIFENGKMHTVAKGLDSQSWQDYRVYPSDVDGDGIMESAKLIPIESMDAGKPSYLLQWYSVDQAGASYTKCYTYHNYAEGWFAMVDSDLTDRLLVEIAEEETTFYFLQSGKPTRILSILALTDADREIEADKEDRVILYKSDAVIYVADLTEAAKDIGVTQELLKSKFFPIRAEKSNEEN